MLRTTLLIFLLYAISIVSSTYDYIVVGKVTGLVPAGTTIHQKYKTQLTSLKPGMYKFDVDQPGWKKTESIEMDNLNPPEVKQSVPKLAAALSQHSDHAAMHPVESIQLQEMKTGSHRNNHLD
ncbi:hypothetical protein DdX_10101 [Ditylenchus destructor]|uniref:Uncharacterized protein n=1 Tax=Ditylenchus destructor TaxID=166010 RepID=A0AAD4N1E0_9BILA|nr:hypothetical protein DdX_10101 [Ditylenchus destructor]